VRLREQFRREGEWLFRWRSYIPLLPLALVIAVALTSFEYPFGSEALDRVWEFSCLFISLFGVLIRVRAVGHAPGGTSGRNTDGQLAKALNTTGMYSVVRHPLYLGNFLMWMGVALLPRSLWLAIVTALFFWIYYERIMFAEEEFLTEQFGDEYLSWARRTPAFLPRFSSWQAPRLRFCLRTVLKRELSTGFALIGVFTLVELASDFSIYGRWTLDPLWAGIFTSGLLVFLLLALLKRKTRMLHVTGR